jgi:tetratricopeptide (TPR) repeat protein
MRQATVYDRSCSYWCWYNMPNTRFACSEELYEEALNQAVALYEQGDNQTSLHAALVSRAGIRCIQGKQEEGLADCDRVLREDAVNKGALENKGRILLNLDRTLEAIACFERILNLPVEATVKLRRYRTSFIGGRQTNIPALLASAYINAGQITKVIELLLPLFKPSSDDRDQLDIAEVLLVAQSKKPDYAAAADTLKIIEATWPQQPEAKAILAEYFARQRDYSQAIKLLQVE